MIPDRLLRNKEEKSKKFCIGAIDMYFQTVL